MTTGHVFIATSLDGFIARLGGEIDWLEGWPEVGHDYGFHEFADTVDGLIMGRGTYEKAATFETWPYAKPVVVMSSTLDESDLPRALPTRCASAVRTETAHERARCRRLEARLRRRRPGDPVVPARGA